MTSLIIARVLLKTLRQSCWKRFHSRLSPTSLVKRYGDFSFLAPPTISPEEIDALLAHRFMIFGHQFQLPEQINWHYDPLSDYAWNDAAPASSFNFLDSPKADVKVVWELSRFQHLPLLAAAFLQKRDQKLLDEITAQVHGWLEQNPLGFGVHWVVPMEAAIRAGNWIATLVLLGNLAPESLVKSMLKSLSEHAAFIYWNIEFGKRNGNHYLSNGMGLLWLGIFLGERKYVRKGFAIVEESMCEQVYDDGVDYEKSVSYHRFVLEMFELSRLVSEANSLRLSPSFYRKLGKMHQFLVAATKPNGTLCNVGDDDSGTVLNSRLLSNNFGLSAAPPLSADLHNAQSAIFKQGGFASLRHHNTHLFFDFGDIGMNGYGGHGHNDTLSFELFFCGEELIVDSGTFNYTLYQSERQCFRSIEAHNTIQIDGKELVLFRNLWSIAADTTKPKLVSWRNNSEQDEIIAEIMNNSVLHRRTIRFDKATHTIALQDKLIGSGTHTAVSRLHFHPNLTPVVSGNIIIAGNAVIRIEGIQSIALRDSSYSKGYYQKTKNLKAELLIEFEDNWQGTIKIERR
ncbi:MAG: heparinase II/III family protein [Chloroherpetonaceae bacterium]|nr:heparinase II/III family protein [Chloroherpetonaceae bacterium]